jgi:hypothetical protein
MMELFELVLPAIVITAVVAGIPHLIAVRLGRMAPRSRQR